MTVKVHLHFIYEPIPYLRIGAYTELGHLYTDDNALEELHQAAERVGMRRSWLQPEAMTGLAHYDLWRAPLEKAKILVPIVDDDTFVADIERLKGFPKGGAK